MEEFLALYEELQSLSRFNPLFEIKRSICVGILNNLKTHEDLPFDKFKEFQQSLGSEPAHLTLSNIEIVTSCIKSEKRLDFDFIRFLEDREILKKYYTFYKTRKAISVIEFEENLKNLLTEALNCTVNFSESFWQDFYLLRSLIYYLEVNSERYKIIQKYTKDILDIYSFYCKKRSEILDTYKNEKMNYFGSVSENYNKIDIAEAFLVREYLTNYDNNDLFNYFFEICGSVCDFENLNISDFSELEERKVLITFEKNVQDIINKSAELDFYNLENYYWIIDDKFYNLALSMIVSTFDDLSDVNVYYGMLKVWISKFTHSFFLFKSCEEIKYECIKFKELLKKYKIEFFDKEDIEHFLEKQWLEVHQNGEKGD